MILLKWKSDYVTLRLKTHPEASYMTCCKSPSPYNGVQDLTWSSFLPGHTSNLPTPCSFSCRRSNLLLVPRPFVPAGASTGDLLPLEIHVNLPLTSFRFLLECHQTSEIILNHSKQSVTSSQNLHPAISVLFFPRAHITIWPSNYMFVIWTHLRNVSPTKAFSFTDLFPMPVAVPSVGSINTCLMNQCKMGSALVLAYPW